MTHTKALNYLIDMDGTLYHGASPIPYAKEFIEYLNRNNRKYLLLTNCPGNSVQALVEKLKSMGIYVNEQNILTSGQAAASFLSLMKPDMSIYLVGSDALKDELLRAGLRIDNENPDCVLVGYDRQFDYEKMFQAVHHILSGSKFICTNGDYTIPEGNKLVPHTGAIAASIEAAAGIKPLIIGKPEKYIIDFALKKLECTKDECCIIGDRLDTDIASGVKHEIPSYLVLTGVTDKALLAKSEVQPTRVFNNLNEIMIYEHGA